MFLVCKRYAGLGEGIVGWDIVPASPAITTLGKDPGIQPPSSSRHPMAIPVVSSLIPTPFTG